MNLWWGLVYVELHHSELFGLLSVSCMHWPFLPSGLAQLNTSSVPDWQHSYSPKDRGATFLEVSPQSLFSHWHRDYCSSTVKAYSIMVGNASAAPALAVVWDDSICHQMPSELIGSSLMKCIQQQGLLCWVMVWEEYRQIAICDWPPSQEEMSAECGIQSYS